MTKKNTDNPLLFGPAGTPHSAKTRSSIAGIQRVKELGLDCMELEFVQGVKMGEKTALEVRQVRESCGIRLTVHAPYFINLNANDPLIMEASKKRILDTARIGNLCGAESIVFHAGYYLGDAPEDVFKTILTQLTEIMLQLEKDKNPIMIRPETTGKATQFGSLEELIRLSKEFDRVLPCVDFSHLHARTNGKYNTTREFESVLEQLDKTLGKRKVLQHMHIHLSGIAYGEKGEKHHLILTESDLRYKDLIKVLKQNKVGGFVISESPNIEADASLLKQCYQRC